MKFAEHIHPAKGRKHFDFNYPITFPLALFTGQIFLASVSIIIRPEEEQNVCCYAYYVTLDCSWTRKVKQLDCYIKSRITQL